LNDDNDEDDDGCDDDNASIITHHHHHHHHHFILIIIIIIITIISNKDDNRWVSRVFVYVKLLRLQRVFSSFHALSCAFNRAISSFRSFKVDCNLKFSCTQE